MIYVAPTLFAKNKLLKLAGARPDAFCYVAQFDFTITMHNIEKEEIKSGATYCGACASHSALVVSSWQLANCDIAHAAIPLPLPVWE